MSMATTRLLSAISFVWSWATIIASSMALKPTSSWLQCVTTWKNLTRTLSKEIGASVRRCVGSSEEKRSRGPFRIIRARRVGDPPGTEHVHVKTALSTNLHALYGGALDALLCIKL